MPNDDDDGDDDDDDDDSDDHDDHDDHDDKLYTYTERELVLLGSSTLFVLHLRNSVYSSY